jgi:hypothetical protein
VNAYRCVVKYRLDKDKIVVLNLLLKGKKVFSSSPITREHSCGVHQSDFMHENEHDDACIHGDLYTSICIIMCRLCVKYVKFFLHDCDSFMAYDSLVSMLVHWKMLEMMIFKEVSKIMALKKVLKMERKETKEWMKRERVERSKYVLLGLRGGVCMSSIRLNGCSNKAWIRADSSI